jgi:hypothetical protein
LTPVSTEEYRADRSTGAVHTCLGMSMWIGAEHTESSTSARARLRFRFVLFSL